MNFFASEEFTLPTNFNSDFSSTQFNPISPLSSDLNPFFSEPTFFSASSTTSPVASVQPYISPPSGFGDFCISNGEEIQRGMFFGDSEDFSKLTF